MPCNPKEAKSSNLTLGFFNVDGEPFRVEITASHRDGKGSTAVDVGDNIRFGGIGQRRRNRFTRTARSCLLFHVANGGMSSCRWNVSDIDMMGLVALSTIISWFESCSRR